MNRPEEAPEFVYLKVSMVHPGPSTEAIDASAFGHNAGKIHQGWGGVDRHGAVMWPSAVTRPPSEHGS